MIEPITLKGFRDSLPETARARNALVRILEKTFESFGFVPIDTPALEYTEILLGKGGGETEKQVYRFTDHGNRDVALRYDLTVPFARFLAGHRSELYMPFKRYHIGKVWRGENTQKGRYREFLQCDFDIVGCDCVSADLEILLLMVESMKALGVETFSIEFSHRGTLNRFLRRLELDDRSVEILRIIDKIEKIGREGVADLLSHYADSRKIDSILAFIQKESSSSETMDKLVRESGGEAEDTERLLCLQNIIEELDLAKYFSLNPSIIRGFDYYTGIVYETYLTDLPQFGAVCAGGRYNDLASLYMKETMPGVGASIGLDRLLAALEEQPGASKKPAPVTLLVLFMEERYLGYYHKIASSFRHAGIDTEVFPQKKRLAKQFQMADKKGIPFALICGEEEKKKNSVTIKDLKSRESYEGLSLEQAIRKLKELDSRFEG